MGGDNFLLNGGPADRAKRGLIPAGLGGARLALPLRTGEPAMRRPRRKEGGRGGLPLQSSLEATAARSLDGVSAAGVEAYDRLRHLPRLLPLEPFELRDQSTATRRRIVNRLARALRAERNRGRAGHWTYDLNRHIGLRQAYAAERRSLGAGERPGRPPHGEGYRKVMS